MSKSSATPIKNTMGAVFIHVKDLKKSVEWYRQLLGVEVDLSKVESPILTYQLTGQLV